MKSLRLLLLTVFLTAPAAGAEILSLNQFSGLNTDDSPLSLQAGQTPDSENVVTDVGPSLEGRKGFIIYSTQPASDLWEFPLSDGTKYLIKRHSDRLLADTGSGTFSTVVSTIPTSVKTVGTVLGDRFYFANTTDGLKYWTGSTVHVASATIKVDKLVTHKGRLWAAGLAAAQRTLFGSAFNNGTSWDLQIDPSDDDPTQIVIGGALDENIQALYSSFQDKLIVFKGNSFHGLFGSKRSNFIIRTFSDTVGVSAPETIQDCDGFLRWLGPDRTAWEFDGAKYEKISEPVDTMMDTMAQGDAASRSHTDTTQTDFGGGSISQPAGSLSTSISPGAVVLSTMAASSQTDTTTGDWSAGTLTNLTDSSGDLVLASGSGIQYQCDRSVTTVATICPTTDPDENRFSQSFQSDDGFVLTSVRLLMQQRGSPGSAGVRIRANNADTPGAILVTCSAISTSDVPDSPSSGYVTSTCDPIRIEPDTRYWVQVYPIGTCNTGSPGNQFLVALGFEPSFPVCNDTTEIVINGNSSFTSGEADYSLSGTTFSSSGNVVSRTFDIGFTTATWLWNWSTFSANGTVPSGAAVTYETQSSADGSNWDALVAVASGAAPTSTVRRYLRYKASVTNTDLSTSTVLTDITMTAGPFRKSTGVFTSEVIEIGDDITSWGPITINDSLGDGSIAYFFNSSTSSSISEFNPASWTAVTSGDIPTNDVNPYAAFRASFTITNATQTPTLNDVTVSWTEGSTIRAASAYFDQRYWLAVAVSSTANNRVFVYDKKRQWQRYSGINADTFGIYRSQLYFGNSGGIFQGETGYSDNGAAISAYYRTKTLAPNALDLYSRWNYLFLTTDSSDSTLATSYQVNGVPTDFNLGSKEMNDTAGIQNFKVPFPQTEVQQGKYISLKWAVSGTDYWRLVNSNLYYETVPATE